MDDLRWREANIKCRTACPVSTNAGLYVQLVGEGRHAAAYQVAAHPNPLVSVCARVCAHPCEDACRRGLFDAPVSIRAMKRVAVDQGQPSGPGTLDGRVPAAHPRPAAALPRVAVIGAGPAGLSCAHDLALLGYPVTIFEQESVPGGMLVLGLADYRLPRAEINADLFRIFDLGVELRTGVRVGHDVTLSALREQGYAAFFLGVGAGRSRRLGVPGEELTGVLPGIDFLRHYNLGLPTGLGQRVLVIGGGNVAVDVARAALRAGAATVTMLCLEARAEMPAWPGELAQALEEGVQLVPRRGPKRLVGAQGRVTGLETLDVRQVFDAQGRFAPAFAAGTETFWPADTVILAIGQQTDWSCLTPADGLALDDRGRLPVDRETLATACPDVFAGGDAAFGPRIIIEACGEGRRAAVSIDAYLQGGAGRPAPGPVLVEIPPTRLGESYLQLARQAEALLAPAARQTDPSAAVELGLTAAAAAAESARCLRCHTGPLYQPEQCILCNLCVDVCPYDALAFVDPSTLAPDAAAAAYLADALADAGTDVDAAAADADLAAGTVLLKDEDRCIRCGLCAARCPTGAMIMAQLSWEEESAWPADLSRARPAAASHAVAS